MRKEEEDTQLIKLNILSSVSLRPPLLPVRRSVARGGASSRLERGVPTAGRLGPDGMGEGGGDTVVRHGKGGRAEEEIVREIEREGETHTEEKKEKKARNFFADPW